MIPPVLPPEPDWIREVQRDFIRDQIRRLRSMMPDRPPPPWHRRVWNRLVVDLRELRHLVCCGRCGDDD